jgi:hypothetical protein
MNTEITRDIVTDLLPAYLAGEASADTQALVQAFSRQDPDFARMLKLESDSLLTMQSPRPLPESSELKALRKTKRFFRLRTWCLAGAVEMTLTAVSYHFGPQGFDWTWQANPLIAIALGLIGLSLWIAYFRMRRTSALAGV